MAKQKYSLIKLQGTIGGLTFVDSKTYAPHTRMPRGSYKEAKVNDTLRSNSDHAKPVTSAGSPILRELKNIERGFAGSDLWSRIIGRMFKAKSAGLPELLESIKGIELNERYSFARLFAALPELRCRFQRNRLFIEVDIFSHPRFAKEVKATHYLCEVTVLFLDGKGNCIKDVAETEWISFGEDLAGYEMEFEKPKNSRYFLAVAGIKAGKDEREIESFAARGFRVSEWGKASGSGR